MAVKPGPADESSAGSDADRTPRTTTCTHTNARVRRVRQYPNGRVCSWSALAISPNRTSPHPAPTPACSPREQRPDAPKGPVRLLRLYYLPARSGAKKFGSAGADGLGEGVNNPPRTSSAPVAPPRAPGAVVSDALGEAGSSTGDEPNQSTGPDRGEPPPPTRPYTSG